MSTTSAPTTLTLRSIWRSARGILLVAVLVVIGAVLPVLLAGPSSPAYLDPRDTSLEGGAALAAVLRERGVEVRRVDSVLDAAVSAGAGTRILVSRPDALTHRQAERLASSGSDLLVVGTAHAEAFLPGVGVRTGAPSQALLPRCDVRAAVRAGSAYLGGATVDPDAADTGCYPIAGRPTLVSADRVTLVTGGAFITNRRIDENGNAALAMNLAGTDPRLVWLVAPATDATASAPGGDQSLAELVPPRVWWATLTLVLAVLLAAVWRGRRLGPVVVEALPVVVRASETVEGRGRLYRARRAREQAARALRTATTARVASWMGLTGVATPRQVAATAADRIGQDARQVELLLDGPSPDDDGALVRLADELDGLERSVRER